MKGPSGWRTTSWGQLPDGAIQMQHRSRWTPTGPRMSASGTRTRARLLRVTLSAPRPNLSGGRCSVRAKLVLCFGQMLSTTIVVCNFMLIYEQHATVLPPVFFQDRWSLSCLACVVVRLFMDKRSDLLTRHTLISQRACNVGQEAFQQDRVFLMHMVPLPSIQYPGVDSVAFVFLFCTPGHLEIPANSMSTNLTFT